MEKDNKSEYLFKINKNKLDTIENRDLFNNLKNHYDKNISENIFIKEEENTLKNIMEPKINSIENLNINSENNKLNISNNDDNKSYKSNNDDKYNCLSFKDFMAKVKNKQNPNDKYASKSFTSKNTTTKKYSEKRKNIQNENNKSEKKKKKKKK